MPLHVALEGKIIGVHEHELRRVGNRPASRRKLAGRAGRTARRGLGWMLVELCLRLAISAED